MGGRVLPHREDHRTINHRGCYLGTDRACARSCGYLAVGAGCAPDGVPKVVQSHNMSRHHRNLNDDRELHEELRELRAILLFVVERLGIDEAALDTLLHPEQFPVTLTLHASLQGEDDMTVTPVFGFADGKGVDAFHQIGTPTFLWTTSGSGFIADPAAAVLTITPSDPANADDVVTCVASNVAADKNGGVQSFTATVDLADGATVLFPVGFSLTVSP